MQVVDYSDKSVVVIGNTKDYKDDLKALGGTYNGKLTVGPGWVFGKTKEQAARDFVDSVNAGETLSIQPRTKVTLESTMNKYQESKTKPVTSNDKLNIRPVTKLDSQPTTLNFPNTFIAADNLTYQIIVLTCPLPSMNQKVTLQVDNQDLEYVVTKVQASNNDILITNDESAISRAVIINGEWQIFCMQAPHKLIFH